MSLLFNMLARLDIAVLPKSKSFNCMAAVTICSAFGAQENEIYHFFHFFPIIHEVTGLEAMMLVF